MRLSEEVCDRCRTQDEELSIWPTDPSEGMVVLVCEECKLKYEKENPGIK